MTPKPLNLYPHECRAAAEGRLGIIVRPVNKLLFHGEIIDGQLWDEEKLYKPPFQVGQQIWGREPFIHIEATYCYEASVSIPACPAHTVYRADAKDPRGGEWKSSTQMPRWASRFSFEVTEVKAMRVQDVTEEMAQQWGCSGHDWQHHPILGPCTDAGELPTEEAEKIWNSIHRKPLSWEDNPWIWCYRVKDLRKENKI